MLTYTAVDELEVVGSEVDRDGGVGEDEDSEVVVVDVRQPLLEVGATFCVEGSHGLAKCKDLVCEGTVGFAGDRNRIFGRLKKFKRSKKGGNMGGRPLFYVRDWLVGARDRSTRRPNT